MKYIVKLDIGGTNYYVRSLKDGWDEIYDPNHATLCNKKETKILIDGTTFGEYCKVVDSQIEIDKFNQWAKDGSYAVTTRWRVEFKNKNLEEVFEYWKKIPSKRL